MKNKYVDSGRKNQKLETREKILVSAQYFLNKGLKFNLEEVANKTGISRATIYRYFSNAEILATEAGLAINTKSPEEIYGNLKDKKFNEKILGIQDYYNTHALNHENTFRKYLSIVITSSPLEFKRGARRNRTLRLALENASLNPKEKEDLSNLLTILMGIEPLIVSKDVSGLDNSEFLELMKWGMNLLLKGLDISKLK